MVGLGVLTVRADGRSTTFESGTVLPIAELQETADRLRTGPSTPSTPVATAPADATEPETAAPTAASPLLAEIAASEAAFTAALEARDVSTAAQTMLDLEASLHGWAADTLQSDELDRGRAALRSMMVRLAAVAEGGAQDPRSGWRRSSRRCCSSASRPATTSATPMPTPFAISWWLSRSRSVIRRRAPSGTWREAANVSLPRRSSPP